MKSKMILVFLSLLLTISTVAGATYAWFIDSDSISSNIITTGNVDISISRLHMNDSVPGPMFYVTNEQGASSSGEWGMHETGLWYPGTSITRQLDVRNVGSLKVRLNRIGAEITSIDGEVPSIMPSLAESFSRNMHVKVVVSGQPLWILYEGSLFDLLSSQSCVYKPVLAASNGAFLSVVQLSFQITMNDNAGNDLQGIVPVVSFFVGAEQTKNNP